LKQKIIPYIYILFSILIFDQSYGQKKVLEIFTTDNTSSFLLRDIQFQKVHFNKTNLLKTLDSVQLKIEKIGFINYSLDSIITSPTPTPLQRKENAIMASDTIYTAFFNLRNQIEKIRVYYDSSEIPSKQLSKINGLITNDYFEVKPATLSDNLHDISNMMAKKGNSFSEVVLKNISFKNNNLIEADLLIKKSALRRIDKVISKGYDNFPKTFLKHNLKLEPQSVFSKEKLDEASNAIYTLPFISEIKPSEVLFTKDSTIIYLYLKKENSNKFDGLIGFTSKENGKGLSFNGYLDLSLNNLFDTGENLNLVWKNNGNNRQVFNLDISLPYIFNSKISPNLALNIYKQDSSFVNTKFKMALPYQVNRRNSFGISFRSESSSNLLKTTTNNIEDYKSIFFGLNYNYIIPNNHPLFKAKFNLFSEVLSGKRNGTVENNQKIYHLKTNFLWSLNFKNHIFLQNTNGLIDSEKLIDNELFRIGGINNLRGFDEQSILASLYSTFNTEYRFNTNNGSYLYSISDFGYVKNKNLSSQLYALGLGYAFTSKLGLINLSYALGKPSDASFNFNNSRFHLKIVNSF